MEEEREDSNKMLNNKHDSFTAENTRMSQFIAYRPSVLIKEGIRFDRMIDKEDEEDQGIMGWG